MNNKDAPANKFFSFNFTSNIDMAYFEDEEPWMEEEEPWMEDEAERPRVHA